MFKTCSFECWCVVAVTFVMTRLLSNSWIWFWFICWFSGSVCVCLEKIAILVHSLCSSSCGLSNIILKNLFFWHLRNISCSWHIWTVLTSYWSVVKISTCGLIQLAKVTVQMRRSNSNPSPRIWAIIDYLTILILLLLLLANEAVCWVSNGFKGEMSYLKPLLGHSIVTVC